MNKQELVAKPGLRCVMIAGGGTGGHLFPGIALAEELRRRHPDLRVVFVGTARGIEVRAVPKTGFDLELLGVRALRGGGAAGVWRGMSQLPQALVAACSLVRKIKPDIAIGVGGYAAGPAMVAARLLGVPCVILEQNAVAGITNRLLGRLAHRVIAALPNKSFAPHKTLILGNPVRRDLLAVRQVPYVPPAKGGPIKLLVMGGSQGARAINQCMLELMPALAKAPFAVHIQHQTGAADAERIAAAYAAAGLVHATATAFIDDMAQAYANCDVALCRSGASTLAELTVCGRPSVLVPYPSAADDHQTANARVLVDAGAATLIAQRDLTAKALLTLLTQWADAPERLRDAAAKAWAQGKPGAVAGIADAIEAELTHV